MKHLTFIIVVLFLNLSTLSWAQENKSNVILKAKILDKASKKPIEGVSLTLISVKNPENITGEFTDNNGNFSLKIIPDTYSIQVETLGYKSISIKSKNIFTSIDLGIIELSSDEELLEGIVIEAKKPEMEIKMDKKIYTVSNDNTVNGGNAGDVLDNIPSVSVDEEGNVSLRGKQNVRVFLNGKSSGLITNLKEALKIIPAQSIDKIEVINNPSARYEAEGSMGIVNIVLKKDANIGLNGSATLTLKNPAGVDLSTNINIKKGRLNYYANIGLNNSKSYRHFIRNTNYLNPQSKSTDRTVNEQTNRTEINKSFNTNFGVDWEINDKLTWSNGISIGKRGESSFALNTYDNIQNQLNYTNIRTTDVDGKFSNFDFTTDLKYEFDKKGHEITFVGNSTQNLSNDDSDIRTNNKATDLPATSSDAIQSSTKFNLQNIKIDYVLPVNEKSNFEAGYFANFSNMRTTFDINRISGNTNVNTDYLQSDLNYSEQVHALYSQYGNKFNKFSYMIGLRWESTLIHIDEYKHQVSHVKRYNNFFPSAFISYEFSSTSSLTASYSRRLNRPRGRMLSPVSNYTSSINFFQGNPDLNPSYSNSFELGYTKNFGYLTLNTSSYINKSTNNFEFIRSVNGINEEGIPVLITRPVNLSTAYNYGVEANISYNPRKWLRLNASINTYFTNSKGDYSFVNYKGETVEQNFDYDAFGWFARLTSNIKLPYEISWQTNYLFIAGTKNSQGNSLAIHMVNLAFTREVLNKKATVSLNVQDLFNSRKTRSFFNLPSANGFSQNQWRTRTINLSFTYRFGETDKKPKKKRRQNYSDNNEFNQSMG